MDPVLGQVEEGRKPQAKSRTGKVRLTYRLLVRQIRQVLQIVLACEADWCVSARCETRFGKIRRAAVRVNT